MSARDRAAAQTISAIAAGLDSLQFAEAARLLLVEQIPIGLGGQITTRVDALALALALGRKAVFLSVDDHPYTQTFQPLCSHVPPDLAWAGPHYGSGRADPNASQLIYDRTRSVIRSANGSLSGALLQAIGMRCGLAGLDTFAVDGSILKWMAVVPSTRDYAESERRRLGVGRHTLGVHLRRGDKKVEAAYVAAARVNAEIARMHEHWKFSSLFLASDSPHARREITLPPGVALIFDDAERRHDNANHKMLFRHPEMADDETRVAYKNIHLLSQCGGVIGQDNAHFATLAAASIALELGDRSRILLIDGKAAGSASRLRSAFARCRLVARSLAKRLVPWMTVSSRAERLRRQRRLG